MTSDELHMASLSLCGSQPSWARLLSFWALSLRKVLGLPGPLNAPLSLAYWDLAPERGKIHTGFSLGKSTIDWNNLIPLTFIKDLERCCFVFLR